ncbi:hypothetical protein [Streptococcus sanguinis]|jgi:hypothetical protein|uniref:hypothetical protein n=1 Tax=Streptococcus sanguinis TaxID=1305 RepID=UPI001D1420E8|nr:hypothetical protein [Streptococcus sanguinis]
MTNQMKEIKKDITAFLKKSGHTSYSMEKRTGINRGMLIKYMSENVKAKSDIGNMTIDLAVKLYPAVQEWLRSEVSNNFLFTVPEYNRVLQDEELQSGSDYILTDSELNIIKKIPEDADIATELKLDKVLQYQAENILELQQLKSVTTLATHGEDVATYHAGVIDLEEMLGQLMTAFIQVAKNEKANPKLIKFLLDFASQELLEK